jgi:hypothetical protein
MDLRHREWGQIMPVREFDLAAHAKRMNDLAESRFWIESG